MYVKKRCYTCKHDLKSNSSEPCCSCDAMNPELEYCDVKYTNWELKPTWTRRNFFDRCDICKHHKRDGKHCPYDECCEENSKFESKEE